jgi:fatty-acyl-CoA synthase
MPTVPLLQDALLRPARLVGDRVAVGYEGRTLSYWSLYARANRVANVLRHGLGLETGVRFALLAMNTLEFPELFFGAAISGCPCVPVNYRLAPAEIAQLLADAEARVLVVDPRLAKSVAHVLEDGFDGRVVTLGVEYEAMLEAAGAEADRRGAADDVVLQIYTSGTTGAPKGAMLSHRNLLANAWSAVAQQNVVEADVYLLVSPLCHLAAGARVFSAALAGASLRLLPAFDAERVVDLIDRGEVTSTVLVPAMLQSMLAAAPAAPETGSRFRRLTYGSAPVPLPVLQAAVERFRCEFQQGYGLTEASPNLTTLLPADHALPMSAERRARLTSVGREAIGVRVRVMRPDGSEAPVGEPGEVVAWGANIMEGYWRRPDESARALRGGGLHTSDLGRMDTDGYLFLVDRLTDMLISGGINVYPREIEVQLEARPDVAEVAVVGRPDPRWGEVPIAFVVPRGVERGDELGAELSAYCRDRMARYKVPAEFRFVAELPRNAGGKVQKHLLKASATASAGREAASGRAG